MAAVTSIVIGASLALTVGGAVQANRARKAEAGARDRADNAKNAQEATVAAQERRKQIREERVRRARIMQSGENTGTAGSSSEAGALGGMSTQLNTNLGFNAGSIMRSNMIGQANQQSFDAQQDFAKWNTVSSIGSSIFQTAAAGGLKGMLDFSGAQPPAPVTNLDIK